MIPDGARLGFAGTCEPERNKTAKEETAFGMLNFVTDCRPGEPCIIQDHERAPLVIKTMEGEELLRLAPIQPWTHERLVSLPLRELLGEALEGGADAYLGTQWVGSTEV